MPWPPPATATTPWSSRRASRRSSPRWPTAGCASSSPTFDCHLVARPAGVPPRTVARLALTLDTIVQARVVDGRLTLASTLAWVYSDCLDGGDPAAPVAGAREAVAAELVRAVGDVVGALPLPAASTAMTVEAPRDTLAATGGWLVVSGDVVP